MRKPLNRELVETFIERYNDFDVEGMLELFTDECTFENRSNSSSSIACQGKERLREMAMKACALFKERKQHVTEWVIDEDKIAVLIDYKATLANDTPLHLIGMSLYEFEKGKIKRLVDFS